MSFIQHSDAPIVAERARIHLRRQTAATPSPSSPAAPSPSPHAPQPAHAVGLLDAGAEGWALALSDGAVAVAEGVAQSTFAAVAKALSAALGASDAAAGKSGRRKRGRFGLGRRSAASPSGGARSPAAAGSPSPTQQRRGHDAGHTPTPAQLCFAWLAPLDVLAAMGQHLPVPRGQHGSVPPRPAWAALPALFYALAEAPATLRWITVAQLYYNAPTPATLSEQQCTTPGCVLSADTEAKVTRRLAWVVMTNNRSHR